METRVVHYKKEPYDEYIGRKPGQMHWGNPFRIGPQGTRYEVIQLFYLWLRGDTRRQVEPKRRRWILKNIELLRGKILGCHCKPKACHGDILAKLADGVLIL